MKLWCRERDHTKIPRQCKKIQKESLEFIIWKREVTLCIFITLFYISLNIFVSMWPFNKNISVFHVYFGGLGPFIFIFPNEITIIPNLYRPDHTTGAWYQSTMHQPWHLISIESLHRKHNLIRAKVTSALLQKNMEVHTHPNIPLSPQPLPHCNTYPNTTAPASLQYITLLQQPHCSALT